MKPISTAKKDNAMDLSRIIKAKWNQLRGKAKKNGGN
jgi:uncharacterized protein YjbJ (UPF0337 family)